MYDERFYRQWIDERDLVRFEVAQAQSDLLIVADADFSEPAAVALAHVRAEIESYIARDRGFAASLTPYPVGENAPAVVEQMARAAAQWEVGPMAAVAGAVSQYVGVALSGLSGTVIVENGGDVYAHAPRPVRFALYAGEASPFTDRVRFEVGAAEGVGVCTSSKFVGPSLSFGRADAVVAIAADVAVADAAATELANQITCPDDVKRVLDKQRERDALLGMIACCGDQLGLWGEIELINT